MPKLCVSLISRSDWPGSAASVTSGCALRPDGTTVYSARLWRHCRYRASGFSSVAVTARSDPCSSDLVIPPHYSSLCSGHSQPKPQSRYWLRLRWAASRSLPCAVAREREMHLRCVPHDAFWAGLGQQPALISEDHGLDAVAQLQFHQHARDVGLTRKDLASRAAGRGANGRRFRF